MAERVAFQIGDWTVFPERNMISCGETAKSLEPKVMALLLVLSDAECRVVSRADIEEDIWGQIIVGEDTVARLVSKLRRAFDETVRSPQYIETISKKGYRLMQVPSQLAIPEPQEVGSKRFSPILVGLALVSTMVVCAFLFWPDANITHKHASDVARANDLYMNFNYTDNETAIKLYEQILAQDGDNSHAQAGLANALVQRVIRWPDGRANSQSGTDSLTDALALDLHETEFGQTTLERATYLAERAVRMDPKNADNHKALGLTYAARGRIEHAKSTYEKAIALDGMAWESMVNLGEIYLMKNNLEKTLEYFSQAYEVMDKSYSAEPQKVGPWQAQMGVSIARLHLQKAEPGEAEIWYRRVMRISPLDKDASVGLAAILRVKGDRVQADAICHELQTRFADIQEC